MALLKVFSKKKLSDEEIIAKYKSTQDTALVGELYQRYTHITLSVCLKYLKNLDDAQDAVMQIFEKIIHDLLKHDVQFFQGWFHTYIRNHCLMELRRAKTNSPYNDQLKTRINEDDIEVEKELELHKDMTTAEINEKLENMYEKNEEMVCLTDPS